MFSAEVDKFIVLTCKYKQKVNILRTENFHLSIYVTIIGNLPGLQFELIL